MTATLSTNSVSATSVRNARPISAALVTAGSEAHARYFDAKTGSRLQSIAPRQHLLARPPARSFPSAADTRRRCSLPAPRRPSKRLVWNGIAILPVKVIETGKRDETAHGARTSDLRSG